MITFGYVKQYRYANDGTLMLQVRIPSVHGPYDVSEYKGRQIRNYIRDSELPWYQSILLPHLPVEGEVVALESINHANTEFLVIGLTGGSYLASMTNKKG